MKIETIFINRTDKHRIRTIVPFAYDIENIKILQTNGGKLYDMCKIGLPDCNKEPVTMEWIKLR